MKVGGREHIDLLCSSYRSSHITFDPAALTWPVLTSSELERIRGVPFWQEVLHTEMRAIRIIEAFAPTVKDPQLKDCLELMAFEELRHERLVRTLFDRYGIFVTEREITPISSDIEREFIDFGFGECVDSFLGFGFFNIARRHQFLPAPLFDILDLLMAEEIRHVLLIVNWMGYREASRGRAAPPLRAITAFWYYARAIYHTVNVGIRNAKENGDGQTFSATQASDFIGEFSLSSFLQECLSENDRRLEPYDKRLLRPTFLPAVARILLPLSKLGCCSLFNKNHSVTDQRSI